MSPGDGGGGGALGMYEKRGRGLGEGGVEPKVCVSPAPLANSRGSARRSPRWGGGGDGRQVTVSRGGGGIARVFQGKLWYPPLMQAKRTRVKRHQGVCTECGKTAAHLAKAPSVREWYRTWSPGENILGLK